MGVSGTAMQHKSICQLAAYFFVYGVLNFFSLHVLLVFKIQFINIDIGFAVRAIGNGAARFRGIPEFTVFKPC